VGHEDLVDQCVLQSLALDDHSRIRRLRALRCRGDRRLLLWCELIIRSVVLTLLLVLVPVIVPLSTFPAMRRLGWRLAETFIAVASSKLLIVIALSLGLDELEGGSVTVAITGAVTLLLATCTPFVLLRVIPFVEQSALHNLEGIRQRFTRSVQNAPSSPLVRRPAH